MLPSKEYTFDNYITGEWSRFACMAAKSVAEKPGIYNPLFIYGKSGMGKTHLLGAVHNYITASSPNMEIFMFSAEELVQELVRLVEAKQAQPWYAELMAADILLIDDVQDLMGKPATQSGFVSLLRSFAEQGKQIVMASSAPPASLPVLDASFHADFESGLLADIGTPDTKDSRMIAKDLAEHFGITLSEVEVIHIASEACGNVSRIKGLVTHLQAKKNIY